MEALRALFAGLGFSRVETLLASGNVVFEGGGGNARALERRIERTLGAELGYEVATFLRTDAEVEALARAQPFPSAEVAAAHNLYVGFLPEAPESTGAAALAALATGEHRLRLEGREIFWLSRVPTSESKLSYKSFERALAMPATFRGMKTLERLAAKYPPRG